MADRNSTEVSTTEQERRAFGHWFAGFTAGEGCFHLHSGGRSDMPSDYVGCKESFDITLRADDAPVLEYIRDSLNCGTIRRIACRKNKPVGFENRKPQTRFEITRRSDLSTVIIPLFDSCPIRAKKERDFVVWKKGVLLHDQAARSGDRPMWNQERVSQFRNLQTEMKDAREFKTVSLLARRLPQNWSGFDCWLSGLVDGEGYFRLCVQKVNGYETYKAIFGIALRQDDMMILSQIRDFLGCGSVYAFNSGVSNSKPQARFEITRAVPLAEELLPVFDRFNLRSKKKREYDIWRKGVLLVAEINHRKMQSKGGVKGKRGGGGWHPIWTQSERAEFRSMADRIKVEREYVELGV